MHMKSMNMLASALHRHVIREHTWREKEKDRSGRISKMNQPNQNNIPDGSAEVPQKRKRGRPRKHPRLDMEEGFSTPIGQKFQNVSHSPFSGGNIRVPPGFGGANGNQPCQRSLQNDSNDVMVGQGVSGIIEAVFDAGYLLSVRVGGSDTTLRGLVFKPGRYVPISAENDVAPGVPMIRRNEVPFSTGTHTQVQNAHSKQRNEQYVNIHRNEIRTTNGTPAVNPETRAAASSNNAVATEGKSVHAMAEKTGHPVARGNVVPVILKPDNLSNRVPVSNQPFQVMIQSSLETGSSMTQKSPADGSQAPSCQTQISQNMMPSSVQNEDDAGQQPSAGMVTKMDVKSTGFSGPFENLVTEVIKRVEAPSDSRDAEIDKNKSGDKLLKHCSSGQDDNVNDTDPPVLIKPLQAVQATQKEHLVSASRPLENNRTDKMTELLQVLQDSAMPTAKAEELASGHKLDDIRSS